MFTKTCLQMKENLCYKLILYRAYAQKFADMFLYQHQILLRVQSVLLELLKQMQHCIYQMTDQGTRIPEVAVCISKKAIALTTAASYNLAVEIFIAVTVDVEVTVYHVAVTTHLHTIDPHA